MNKLLDLRDYSGIVSQTVDRSDIELLLDFILHVRMSRSICEVLCLTHCRYSAIAAFRNPTFKMPIAKPGD